MNRESWGMGVGDITGKQMCAYDLNSVLPTSCYVGADPWRSLPVNGGWVLKCPYHFSKLSVNKPSRTQHRARSKEQTGCSLPLQSRKPSDTQGKKAKTNQTTNPRITQLGIREGENRAFLLETLSILFIAIVCMVLNAWPTGFIGK